MEFNKGYAIAGAGILVIFIITGIMLLHYRFFAPKFENAQRKVYENSQSYVHGKLQDLAKYYEEYQKTNNKIVIANLVKMNFADFDANKIQSIELRNFLKKMRGY